MKRHVPYMMASGLIAAILLAGCSSNTDTASSSAAGSQTAQTQSDGTAAQPAASPGARDRGMNRVGMNIGKIKNISGSTITVYTAEMPAGREGSGGTAPQGLANPPEGGEGGQPPEGGTAPEGGRRQGGKPGDGMMQNFSGETTDITVDSDTQFVSVTFDNGEQKETVISLADLKADDVIQYTLKTDTTNAEKITLGAGGFGGGGNGQGKGGSSAAGWGS
ncbi:hypothetical protein PAECIP111892_05486 [Paenibacillus auburnensis]|uniref:DUF5666 domain-containing protein n=1 Tax=Paenibacillus auburnensis TaxID=2905649 RepID=A0ABN8H256_9BACL|nr:hypothetical protein [Paenibacillus auburnensis]CAH1224375.1 hypothetical protein PAECIP111892_05486 [Paenibacillus auburnensis]